MSFQLQLSGAEKAREIAERALKTIVIREEEAREVAERALKAIVIREEEAREIAERALKTIAIREEKEKLNVWIAMLNMENLYGSNDSLEEVFKRACQYNDAQEVHERLTGIYIKSGKTEVRLDLPASPYPSPRH